MGLEAGGYTEHVRFECVARQRVLSKLLINRRYVDEVSVM